MLALAPRRILDSQDRDQGNGEAERKPDELKWRKSEVWSGWASVLVQGLVALAAPGAVYIAIRATDAARDAIVTTGEGMERQANEDRLSTAIQAIGGDQPGERVGGLALLRRLVGSQLLAAIDEEGSDEDAALLYTTALDVLENYLRNPPDDPTDGGLGYGTPDVPVDNVYAANELEGDGGPEVGGGGARHRSRYRRRSGECPATRPALEGHRLLVARRSLLRGYRPAGSGPSGLHLGNVVPRKGIPPVCGPRRRELHQYGPARRRPAGRQHLGCRLHRRTSRRQDQLREGVLRQA